MGEKFVCKRKFWESFNEKRITNLMDTGLENVVDVATVLFNAIQTSQKPGGEVLIPQAPPASTQPATPSQAVTARRVENERRRLGLLDKDNNVNEDDADSTAGASRVEHPTRKTALHP